MFCSQDYCKDRWKTKAKYETGGRLKSGICYVFFSLRKCQDVTGERWIRSSLKLITNYLKIFTFHSPSLETCHFSILNCYSSSIWFISFVCSSFFPRAKKKKKPREGNQQIWRVFIGGKFLFKTLNRRSISRIYYVCDRFYFISHMSFATWLKMRISSNISNWKFTTNSLWYWNYESSASSWVCDGF